MKSGTPRAGFTSPRLRCPQCTCTEPIISALGGAKLCPFLTVYRQFDLLIQLLGDVDPTLCNALKTSYSKVPSSVLPWDCWLWSLGMAFLFPSPYSHGASPQCSNALQGSVDTITINFYCTCTNSGDLQGFSREGVFFWRYRMLLPSVGFAAPSKHICDSDSLTIYTESST